MPTLARKRGGQKAVYAGRAFEAQFAYCAKQQGCEISRLPDGCRVVGKNNLIRVRTPFDYILSHLGRIAFLDTKTTQGGVFNKAMIDLHQLRELSRHAFPGAVIAGYVIQFRKFEKIVFVKTLELKAILDNPVLHSVCPADGVTIYENKTWNILKIFEEIGKL